VVTNQPLVEWFGPRLSLSLSLSLSSDSHNCCCCSQAAAVSFFQSTELRAGPPINPPSTYLPTHPPTLFGPLGTYLFSAFTIFIQLNHLFRTFQALDWPSPHISLMHNTSLPTPPFFPLAYIIRSEIFRVIEFHPWRVGLYDFSSMESGMVCSFIRGEWGYMFFHPSARKL